MEQQLLLIVLQYIIIAVLTFSLSSYIIKYNSRIKARGIKKVMKSQSTIYNKVKDFVPQNLKVKSLFSQSKIHSEKYMLRVMVIDTGAYWVKDNSFFMADVKNGMVIPESTRKIDTVNMSKEDIDKMMFILDKLKEEQQ